MDTLPTEVLLSIFSHLSQRYVVTICSTVCKEWNKLIIQPWFYSTIHIYSKQQLKRFIQIANKKKIKNDKKKRISYYVKRIIFHYRYEGWNNDITELLIFPHLQYVQGIMIYHSTTNINKSIYLELYQPKYIAYWYFNAKWIIKLSDVKDYLKSLHIHITDELYDFIPEQDQQLLILQKQQQYQLQLQSTEIIYLKSIGKKIINSEENLNIPIKLLVLPNTSLMNLTKLKIDFYNKLQYSSVDKYIIDENSIENIHQSCPHIKLLSLEDFVMNISNEYYINKNKIIPAQLVKHLNIAFGKFNHPLCYSYLATKYPHLESLNINFYFKRLPLDESSSFKNAIFNMILQFSLLKNVSLGSTENFNDFFPHPQFINWLYHHPRRFDHLAYTSSLLMSETNGNDNDNNDNILPLLQQQKQQPFFLNYLTSLSLCIDDAFDFVKNYLLQNINTTIISNVLKELTIIRLIDSRTNDIYIYDWLNFFPNLVSLILQNAKRIKDNSNYDDDNDDYNDCEDKHDKDSIHLHQLIKNRKQQLNNDSLNEDHSYYYYPKLKHLHISRSNIWFKNGLDELLKKCQNLNELELNYLNFVVPISYPVNELYFDLSPLHLELFYIRYFSCTPCDDLKYIQRTFKITLQETLNDRKRVLKILKDKNNGYTLNLYLKCKYVDGFVHNFL